MTIDDRTLRGVARGSVTGPFSAPEIAASTERLDERRRVEAVAAAAGIRTGWAVVHAKTIGANVSATEPAKGGNHGWAAIAARDNAEQRTPVDDDEPAKASRNNGWSGFLPDRD